MRAHSVCTMLWVRPLPSTSYVTKYARSLGLYYVMGLTITRYIVRNTVCLITRSVLCYGFDLNQVNAHCQNTFSIYSLNIFGFGHYTIRVQRDSVVKCLTRNPGVLGSSWTGYSGFFRGSILGQDTSELQPSTGETQKRQE